MRNVTVKCPVCRMEVNAVQYEGVKKIQGFCCEKNFTIKLSRGCGIPLLLKDKGGKGNEGTKAV